MAKTPQYKDYPFAHCADLRRPNLGRLKGLVRQDPEYEQGWWEWHVWGRVLTHSQSYDFS